KEPFDQRVRFVVVAGELAGPEEALKELQKRKDDLTANEEKSAAERWAPVLDILTRLYRDYQQEHFDHPSLQEDEVRRLRSGLGWYGDLALAPAGGDASARRAALVPAQQTFLACVAVLFWFGIFGLFGLVGLVTFLVLVFARQVRGGLRCGSGHG